MKYFFKALRHEYCYMFLYCSQPVGMESIQTLLHFFVLLQSVAKIKLILFLINVHSAHHLDRKKQNFLQIYEKRSSDGSSNIDTSMHALSK